MRQLDEMVPPKQTSTWPALEVVQSEGGYTLRFKHWKQHIWGLTGLGVFIPLVLGGIGFSHSTKVGIMCLTGGLFAALLAVVGSMSLLDGSPVFRSCLANGKPQLSVGGDLWADDVEMHEFYFEALSAQRSYIIARDSSRRAFLLLVHDTKPKESLVQKFCEKSQIPYQCHEFAKRKELNAAYEQL